MMNKEELLFLINIQIFVVAFVIIIIIIIKSFDYSVSSHILQQPSQDFLFFAYIAIRK
jgi:hypothetical protein